MRGEMHRAALTDLLIRNLKPPESGQVMQWDAGVAGFGLRVSQGGNKTFYLVHGRQRNYLSLGKYPTISLSDARAEAKRLLAEFTLGKRQAPSISFADALALYLSLSEQINRPRTVAENKRLLTRHFKFHKNVSDITPQEISKIIDRLHKTPTEANHAFTAIRTFFNWCVRRHHIQHSPMAGMRLPAKTKSRARVLTNAEVAAVYRSCDALGAFGVLVRLCILTGQRRGEIGLFKWEYLTPDDTLTLPAALTKNGREHSFPLGKESTALIRALPHRSSYLFPGRNLDDAFQGWAKSKARLDQTIASNGGTVAPWTLHDLRRTFATNLADLKVPPHVIERILNHASGTISGVAAIYNRFSYMDEMRAAIEAWEKRLSYILSQHRSDDSNDSPHP
jgi:integrase